MTTAPSSPQKYQLEMTVTRDLAPHTAFRLASMDHEFALVPHEDPTKRRIVTWWRSRLKSPLAVSMEICRLQQLGEFPKADITITGPLP